MFFLISVPFDGLGPTATVQPWTVFNSIQYTVYSVHINIVLYYLQYLTLTIIQSWLPIHSVTGIVFPDHTQSHTNLKSTGVVMHLIRQTLLYRKICQCCCPTSPPWVWLFYSDQFSICPKKKQPYKIYLCPEIYFLTLMTKTLEKVPKNLSIRFLYDCVRGWYPCESIGAFGLFPKDTLWVHSPSVCRCAPIGGGGLDPSHALRYRRFSAQCLPTRGVFPCCAVRYSCAQLWCIISFLKTGIQSVWDSKKTEICKIMQSVLNINRKVHLVILIIIIVVLCASV